MPIIIRPSLERDIRAIHAIYRPAVLEGTASFELDPPDTLELARRRSAIVAERCPYLVAEINETVVGYAYAGKFRPRPGYRFTVEDSVYVAPQSQGLGIGKALLARLIGDCETLGYRQMLAVIGDSGNAGSIKLHRALGFEHVGTTPNVGFKFGRWLDVVYMQRALGSGAETPPA